MNNSKNNIQPKYLKVTAVNNELTPWVNSAELKISGSSPVFTTCIIDLTKILYIEKSGYQVHVYENGESSFDLMPMIFIKFTDGSFKLVKHDKYVTINEWYKLLKSIE